MPADSAPAPGSDAIDTVTNHDARRLRFPIAIGIALAVVAVDQLTKRWAVTVLADEPVVLIDGWLELDLVLNPGAAFSSVQGAGPLLAIAAIAIAGWITILIRRATTRTAEVMALALVLGGAVGNLVDRLTRGDGLLDGAVVDFVELSFWPTFNVADAAISVGAVLLVIVTMRHGDRSPAAPKPDTG